MDVTQIVSQIDAEIARLQQARAALVAIGGSGTVAAGGTGKRRGRPKGSTNVAKPAKRKRNLSPEGRKAIQEAMKRRWAARKTAAKKDSSK